MSFKGKIAAAITLVSLSISLTPAHAEDTVAPILDQSGYAIIAILTVNEGREEDYIRIMSENVVGSRMEEGVISYRAYRRQDDPLVFINEEHFVDEAAFQAHLETSHVLKAIEELDGVLAEPVEIIVLEQLQ